MFEEIDAESINFLPALREHQIVFDASETGNLITFKLESSTPIGITQSVPFSFTLAAVPDKPQEVPKLNLAQTTSSQIHVDYAPLSNGENGGSEVLSYELSVYDKQAQEWQSLTGGPEKYSLLTSFVYMRVNKGETYQLRYRAWNINGAGEWSDSGYILAAQVPSRPLTPTYLHSDETSITLGFEASADDGGLIISHYVLQVSEMEVTNWQDVISYDGITLSHTVSTSVDPIVANSKDRFHIKAVNDYGSSEWSPTIDLVVAPLPSAPSAPTKVQQLSS